MARVRIKNMNVEYEVEVGSTLLDSSLDGGVDHPHDCGGNCACSTCKVVIHSGGDFLSSQEEEERETLDAYGWDPNDYRLACQCVIRGEGEIVIEMPEPE